MKKKQGLAAAQAHTEGTFLSFAAHKGGYFWLLFFSEVVCEVLRHNFFLVIHLTGPLKYIAHYVLCVFHGRAFLRRRISPVCNKKPSFIPHCFCRKASSPFYDNNFAAYPTSSRIVELAVFSFIPLLLYTSWRYILLYKSGEFV
jgi:hypothetical protein